MRQRLTAYYAHSMGIYNTPQEKRDLETIAQLGFNVLNPNQKRFQEEAKIRKMDVFRDLVKECDILIFRAHVDMLIGSGVAMEIQWALEQGMPVIELPSRMKHRFMNRETTIEYLQEVGER